MESIKSKSKTKKTKGPALELSTEGVSIGNVTKNYQ